MIHGPCAAGAGGSTSLSGCPESTRLMSGSGPFGPMTHGVWQSLHPDVVTMYLPRAIFSAVLSAALDGAWALAGATTATVAATAMARTAYSTGMRFILN